MRRTMTILILAMVVSFIQVAEVWAGAAAEDVYDRFYGPSLNVTAEINADSVNVPATCPALGDPWAGSSCPSQGTVAMRLEKNQKTSGAIFLSNKVAQFAWGCDGSRGATAEPTPPLTGPDFEQELAERRFLGRPGWIPNAVVAALLAPFAITHDLSVRPPVISHISKVACTQIGGVWFLSFEGILQFGRTTGGQ